MKTQNINFVSLCFIFILISNSLTSQISKGGTPPSFTTPFLQDWLPEIQMPAINIDSLLTADSLESINRKIFRFGYAIDVNIGLHNSGTWDTLQNGDRIWRLKISSIGAFSINLLFDDFWLAEGTQFFVKHKTI